MKTGKSGCQLAHGKELFDLLSENPEHGALFGSAMLAVHKPHMTAIAAGYDFSDVRKVCDVGGGIGALLIGILLRHPNTRGVLFDMEQVTERAKEQLRSSGLTDRCDTVSGSFFDSVPEGCDVYILNQVIHDWDDEQSLKILRNVRRAMKPGARLLVTEMLLKDKGPRRTPAKLLDVEMLVLTGGRERTPAQMNALFAQSSFRPSRLVSLVSPLTVSEAIAI